MGLGGRFCVLGGVWRVRCRGEEERAGGSVLGGAGAWDVRESVQGLGPFGRGVSWGSPMAKVYFVGTSGGDFWRWWDGAVTRVSLGMPGLGGEGRKGG